MQITICAHGIIVTDEMRRATRQRLELALDRLEGRIENICVQMLDTNGPFLGGDDKACRVLVQIHQQDSLILEDIGATVEEVIDRMTERLGVLASQRADALHSKKAFFPLWPGDRSYGDSLKSTGTN